MASATRLCTLVADRCVCTSMKGPGVPQRLPARRHQPPTKVASPPSPPPSLSPPPPHPPRCKTTRPGTWHRQAPAERAVLQLRTRMCNVRMSCFLIACVRTHPPSCATSCASSYSIVLFSRIGVLRCAGGAGGWTCTGVGASFRFCYVHPFRRSPLPQRHLPPPPPRPLSLSLSLVLAGTAGARIIPDGEKAAGLLHAYASGLHGCFLAPFNTQSAPTGSFFSGEIKQDCCCQEVQ